MITKINPEDLLSLKRHLKGALYVIEQLEGKEPLKRVLTVKDLTKYDFRAITKASK